MVTIPSKKIRAPLPSEHGQAMLVTVVALGIFLLGVVAFGVDIVDLWFHRQAAQTAADAACTAGVMDMLYQAEDVGTYSWFTNQITDCSGNSSGTSAAAPCWYAAKNGYSGADYSAGVSSVALSYPTSNSNINVCSSSPGPVCVPSYLGNPFLKVNIRDRVRVFFAALVNGGKTTMDVGAQAVCAVVQVQSPIPLLVLDPHDPAASGKKNGSAFSVQGTPTVAIWGGPTQSIQVDDGDSNAVNVGGSGTVDLTLGGPPGPGTGSNFGVSGGPTTNPGVTCGTGDPNCWISPHSPISDPFASLVTPGPPLVPTGLTTGGGTVSCTATQVVNGNCQVPNGIDGCADSKNKCIEYLPGYYANGITVKGATALFEPGIYYLAGGSSGGFQAQANSCLRPSTFDYNNIGIGGVMLYLSGSGTTVNVVSNSGSKCVTDVTNFNTQTGSGILANGVKCTSGSAIPSNLPATLTGNVMLAPCTGPYGDPLEANGQTDPSGEQRGMLLFQDRSDTTLNSQVTGPSWGGAGSFLLAGTMYFHACNATGTGEDCGAPPTYWSDDFTLQGSSGSATWVLGDIVVDNLVLGGSSAITMDLNSTAAFYILKATLLQ